MHSQLNLTADQLLGTTRSVRKRLDTSRRVSRELIEECLELAFQAPNGSNLNAWRWIVVDDPELVRKVGAVYHGGYESMLGRLGDAVGSNYVGATVPGADRITQVGLFPVAYTLGTDFRPAWRKPVAEVVGWNRFKPGA